MTSSPLSLTTDIRLASDIAELVSPNNLVYKAARLMQRLAQEPRRVHILARAFHWPAGWGAAAATLP